MSLLQPSVIRIPTSKTFAGKGYESSAAILMISEPDYTTQDCGRDASMALIKVLKGRSCTQFFKVFSETLQAYNEGKISDDELKQAYEKYEQL